MKSELGMLCRLLTSKGYAYMLEEKSGRPQSCSSYLALLKQLCFPVFTTDKGSVPTARGWGTAGVCVLWIRRRGTEAGCTLGQGPGHMLGGGVQGLNSESLILESRVLQNQPWSLRSVPKEFPGLSVHVCDHFMVSGGPHLLNDGATWPPEPQSPWHEVSGWNVFFCY